MEGDGPPIAIGGLLMLIPEGFTDLLGMGIAVAAIVGLWMTRRSRLA